MRLEGASEALVRAVAVVERDFHDVLCARGERVRRFREAASADILHDREARGIAECVRQVKTGDATDLRDPAQGEIAVQVALDGE